MRFDLDDAADPQIGYKLLTATVTPRPIAWVTSLGPGEVVNAAPYSFFNAMGHTPPTVALGLLRAPDRGFKDTATNILERAEFVINLVSQELGEAMNATSASAPSTVSELSQAGLETAPSTHVATPRIARAPVAFECALHTSVVTGPQQMVVIGRVRAIHVADAYVLDAERAHVDTPALRLIARMHGRGWYLRDGEFFQMDRP